MQNLDPEFSRRLVLSIDQIDDILSIYKPEHRYVADASLVERRLDCSLRASRYPYTQQEIFNYLTAPTVTILACQLMYVLVGALVIDKSPIAQSIASWEEYVNLRDRALLRIGNIKFHFKSEVVNREPIAASVAVRAAHALASAVHCRFVFSIGDGINGDAHGLIMKG
jgi:hypothetical protein